MSLDNQSGADERDKFEVWIHSTCFRKPPQWAYKFALESWNEAIKQAQPSAPANQNAMQDSKWKPTPEAINALPFPIRSYIHDLSSLCDPQFIMQENARLRDESEALQRMYRKAADKAPHWYDSPQAALGGKTAREGYAANPLYAANFATPADIPANNIEITRDMVDASYMEQIREADKANDMPASDAANDLRKLFVELTNTQEVVESGAVVGHIIFNEQLDRLEKLAAAPKECATTVAMIDEALAEGSDYHDLRARLIALLAQQPVATTGFKECSTDPSSCPENEGHGCCKPNPVSAMTDDAIECLQDVISHHNDFDKACWLMVSVSQGSGDESYWMKQVKVLERMKGQAERALAQPSASTTVMQDEANSPNVLFNEWAQVNLTDGNGYAPSSTWKACRRAFEAALPNGLFAAGTAALTEKKLRHE